MKSEEAKIREDGDMILKEFGSMEMAVAVWCGRSVDSVLQDYFCRDIGKEAEREIH